MRSQRHAAAKITTPASPSHQIVWMKYSVSSVYARHPQTQWTQLRELEMKNGFGSHLPLHEVRL